MWSQGSTWHQNAFKNIELDNTFLPPFSWFQSSSFSTGHGEHSHRPVSTHNQTYLLLSVSPVLLFQALDLSQLCIAQFRIGTLMCPQLGQLFFFHDFQQSLLNGFPNQHFQDWLDFNVKVKELWMRVSETKVNDPLPRTLSTSWQGAKEDDQNTSQKEVMRSGGRDPASSKTRSMNAAGV